MLLAAKTEKAPAYRVGGATLFLAAAVILTALAFERFGGYSPCPLTTTIFPAAFSAAET